MPLPPTSFENTLGPYRLLRVIGEGGMGTVYLALDEALNRQVAIKVLRVAPDNPRAGAMTKRFMREAQSAAKLNHPHVVTIHAVVRAVEATAQTRPAVPPYIVMEHVEGGSLAQRVRRDGPLYWREAAAAARDALRALAAAHRVGIVHRDVKPANLMCARGLEGEELVKLADFGLARVAEAGDGELTFPGAFVGSPSYAAPEQVAGAAQIDGRADLYSLAATMYALATGQPPFVGDDPADIMERQMREAFPDVRTLAPTATAAFQALIARASEKRADKRFAGAEKMLTAVEALLETPVEKTRPKPARVTRPPKPQQPPLPSVSPAEATVVELESRLAKARKTSNSSTQLETLRSLYGLYAQLDRRDDALRAAREALAVHVKMRAPGAAGNN